MIKRNCANILSIVFYLEEIMEKKEMFNQIIGYENEKDSLKRIIDILNNKEKYKEFDVKVPNGLLLYGAPGLGKSSMSYEFIKCCQRKSYIIRKIKSNGDFIHYLNTVFKEAEKNQPSVILLDDLDKFSENNNKTNNEEFVTVQALIDSIKDKDIFVIATVNDKYILPKSLLRPGRFDIQIEIKKPNDKELIKIFEYYLKNKKISKDVNIKNISYILNGSSCATLEKVCNQAGIYAGYKNKTEIEMEDLLKASLEYVYDTIIEDIDKEDKYTIKIAYHEAGHTLIGELLEPGSVLFATTIKTTSNINGVTVYHNDDNYWEDIKFMENRIKTLLAGKAATEIAYKTCDTGSNSDIHKAYNIARRFVDNYCMLGFNAWISDNDETSEKVKQNKDEKTNELITKYYEEVKNLLIKNRKKLDVLAKELHKNKILFKKEIKSILSTF